MKNKAEARAQAFLLYQAGASQKHIAQQLKVAEQTVSHWKKEDYWRDRVKLSTDEVVPVWAGRLLSLLETQFTLTATMREQLLTLLPPESR